MKRPSLMLIFEVAGQRHALSCERIIEVVPWVRLHEVSTGPTWLRGLFPYRGVLTPVADLGQLLAGTRSVNLLSSRIALLRVPSQRGEPSLMGLLAEKMTEVRPLRIDTAAPPVSSHSELGRLLIEDGRLLQVIDEQRLLERLAVPHLAPLLPKGPVSSEEDRDDARA